MRATKDSGLEWIGVIPAGWSLSKIGQVYRLRNTKVSDTDYPPLSVTNKGIVPQLDRRLKQMHTMTENLLKEETLRSIVVLTDEVRVGFLITTVPYHLSIQSWHH